MLKSLDASLDSFFQLLYPVARGSDLWIIGIDNPELLDNPKDSKSFHKYPLLKEIITVNHPK